MSYPQASHAYTEASVMSATPEQLVVMLYDGAIRFMHQGAVALEGGHRDVARVRLYRAESIINELKQSLNMEEGGEIAQNLRALYLWAKERLLTALTDQNPAMVREISEQLRDLRGSWAEAASIQASVPS
jgi:flagellar protein FliS